MNDQGQEKDLPELPKSSRRQSMGNMRESHAKEKSDRPRQHKKSSKHSQQRKDTCNEYKPTYQTMANDMDSLQGSDLQPRTLPDVHKRSRSNKAKDASNGGSCSSKSRSRAQPRDPNLDQELPSRSSSKSRNKQTSFEEEDGQLQRASSKVLLTN